MKKLFQTEWLHTFIWCIEQVHGRFCAFLLIQNQWILQDVSLIAKKERKKERKKSFFFLTVDVALQLNSLIYDVIWMISNDVLDND